MRGSGQTLNVESLNNKKKDSKKELITDKMKLRIMRVINRPRMAFPCAKMKLRTIEKPVAYTSMT